MRRARLFLLAPLAVALLLPLSPALADGSCVSGFRAAFEKLTAPARRVQEAAHDLLSRKGRAQAADVQKILDEKAADTPEAVKAWEDDVTERMSSSARYPKVEELLALMAAKSPTFKAGLLDFLNEHGTVRFKVLAGFLQKMNSKVSYGTHFWNLWRSRIKLPSRQAWTSDDFALFMTETSNALFRAIHPEPGFATTWIKAFGQARLDPESWALWKTFADRILVDYRARYRDFVNGVADDAYGSGSGGRPRPDVIRDFYKWGMWDTVYRHLAAAKVAVSKSGGRIIEQGTGLKPEELDALSTNPLYSRLPRSVKNALIIAKNPELYRAALFDAEVEQLSLEVMWFTQPVIEGMILYISTIEPAYSAYETYQDRRKFQADVQAHPDRYLPHYDRADNDRLANFDEQLELLSAQRARLEGELAAPQTLSTNEQLQRRRALDRIDRRITALNQLKSDLLLMKGGTTHGNG